MTKHIEGCPACEEDLDKTFERTPDGPGNHKQIRAYMHCGLCVQEFMALREKNDPSVEGISAGDYQRLEIGNTVYGFQVWCTRHNVNVIHTDFQGKKIRANMTRAASPRRGQA